LTAFLLPFALFFYKKTQFLGALFFVLFIGFTAPWLKTSYLNTPQLKTAYGPVEISGILEKIDDRPQDIRFTLIVKSSSKEIPPLNRVRIACKGYLGKGLKVYPGDTITLKAMLLPPPGAAHPYGYNFRRQAYFDGLSAVGYGLSRPKVMATGHHVSLKNIQHALTEFLRTSIGGQEGEIAAALITGDRSGITDHTRQVFADAGIAHVLAISGLHLSLVAGFFFLILRFLFALTPLALHYNTKK
jgi:competence protein ComEC